MKRYVLILLAALAMSAFGSTAVAQAGCISTPGRFYESLSTNITGTDIDCTSNNGHQYELRIYGQANNGGWHIVTPADVQDFFPPTGYSNSFNASFSCSYWPSAATSTRNKSVLENVTSGSIAVTYGPASAWDPSC